MEALPTTLELFLVWIVSGGAGVVTSMLLDPAKWYQGLPTPAQKRVVAYGICAGIGLVALGAQVLMGYREDPETWRAWAEVVYATVANLSWPIILNQLTHSARNQTAKALAKKAGD